MSLHVTPTQTYFLIGGLIGGLFSLIGNHLITIHYTTFTLQLEPRILFDIISFASAIVTVIGVFKWRGISAEIRYGLAGFTIPLSTLDFYFLFTNVIPISQPT